MKKTLIILGIILAAGVGVWLLARDKRVENVIFERPWIEVIEESASEIGPSGEFVRGLQTGDEIADGMSVKTDAAGQVVIYFPDGSEARLEPNTAVTISNSLYNDKSGSLIVRLTLSAGRVWSKVISLSTPESEWRVDTANAVATVRGTAFGSEYNEGNTNFVGSENTVLIKLKDPETKKEIDETATELKEEDLIGFSRLEINRLAVAKSPLAKNKIDAETREDFKNWVNVQREKDNVLQNRLEALKEQGFTETEAKIELRQEIRENFIEKIIERREAVRVEAEEVKEEDGSTAFISRILIPQLREKIVESLVAKGEREAALKVKNLSDAEISALLKRFFNGDFSELISSKNKFSEIINDLVREYGGDINGGLPSDTIPLNTNEQTTSGGVSGVKVIAFGVSSEINLLNPITEGREVRLKAIAKMSDGTTLDVTGKAKWQVIGPVGTVPAPGVFAPRLSVDVAELGESFGSVTAVFEDTSGAIFLGKTPIFKVVPETPISTEQAG